VVRRAAKSQGTHALRMVDCGQNFEFVEGSGRAAGHDAKHLAPPPIRGRVAQGGKERAVSEFHVRQGQAGRVQRQGFGPAQVAAAVAEKPRSALAPEQPGRDRPSPARG
jgi:hypothetical protein